MEISDKDCLMIAQKLAQKIKKASLELGIPVETIIKCLDFISGEQKKGTSIDEIKKSLREFIRKEAAPLPQIVKPQ